MANQSVYSNFRFRVEIDGIGLASFSEVELPESHVEVIEYRDGSDITTRKLSGISKYGNRRFAAA